jgi:hypothetical protein
VSAKLRIETIGRCVAYVGERRIDQTAEVVLGGLLLLGLEPGRRRGRSEIAQILWPRATTSTQLMRLRWLLSKIRGLGLALNTNALEVSLDPRCIRCDIDEFDPEAKSVDGPILGDYGSDASPALSSWVEEQRNRISFQLLSKLVSAMDEARERSDWQNVKRTADSIRVIDPWHEEATLQLAEATCRLGDKTGGLRVLTEFIAGVGGECEISVRVRLLEQRLRQEYRRAPTSELRFVGRAEQLREIDGLLQSAREGRGGSLILTGPAGIGKTRLLDEARKRGTLTGMQAIRIRCHRANAIRPLSTIVELVQAAVELPGALGCDPAKLEFLRQLTQPDISARASEVATQNSAWVKRQTVDALAELCGSISEETPLCIQVDDIQWSETSVRWFWNPLIGRCADRSIALLFAFRTSPRTICSLDAPQLAVPALDFASASELLDGLLLGHEADARIEVHSFCESSRATAPVMGLPTAYLRPSSLCSESESRG